MKMERQDETQFTTKIDGFLNFPPLNANVLFCMFLNKSHPVYDLKVLVLCLSYFTNNSNIW